MLYDKYIEAQLELKYQRLLLEEEEKKKKQQERGGTFTTDNIDENNKIEIPDDLFDDIINYDDLKRFLLTALKKNKRVAALLVGPPATAKTMFLYDLLKLNNAMFITAYNTTKAGLRDIFLEQDPKYVAIDEIEKANTETTHTLLSVIENGVVQKTIAGQHIERKVDPIIFASCNNENKLSGAILSRFKIFRLNPYNREALFKIGMNIVSKMDISVDLREQIVEIILDSNLLRDPRDFTNILNFVRTDNIQNFKNDIEGMKDY